MDFEAAGTSEAASTLECLRQRILSTVSDWVSRCQIRLVTSELVRVLFAFCSMTPVPTTMATLCLHLWSIIGSLKLISTLRLSIQTVGQASGFVQPWMGEHVFDMVAVIPTSQIRWDLSHIQLIWIDLFAFYCVWLLYNKTVFIWHVYYIKIQHTSGGPVKFISTQYTCVTNFYHFTQPYATSSISSLDTENTMLLNSTSFERLFNFLQLTYLDYWL